MASLPPALPPAEAARRRRAQPEEQHRPWPLQLFQPPSPSDSSSMTSITSGHAGIVESWKHAEGLARCLRELATNPAAKIDAELVKAFVDEEFPQIRNSPTAADLDDSVSKQGANGRLFDMGQWVEHLHDDMRWHLEPIARIVVRESVDDQGNILAEELYKTRSGVVVSQEDVRAPEEALKRAFGMRPWVWQQFAILKLEEYVRFQQYHDRDFENVDYMVLPARLYASWLEDPRNAEFKALHDSQSPCARIKLRDHILSPFHLMNVSSKNTDPWNVTRDATLSVFQYVAFLGSGWSMACVVLVLQTAVPIFVLVYAIRTSHRFAGRSELGGEHRPLPWNVEWNVFCYDAAEPLDAYLMSFLVWLVYAIRVLPKVYQQVYSCLGDEPTIESRLNSLRLLIFLQCDDTLAFQMGFKLQRHMKSVYVALVNLLQLFVVFLTSSTIEAILNALALEWIVDFDIELSSLEGFDPDRRFIRASIVEMVMSDVINLEALESAETFAETYDIDPALVHGPMYDFALALRDCENERWLSPEDRFWRACANLALQRNNAAASVQYFKHIMAFGLVDQIRVRLGLLDRGVFHRYQGYRTWSRWDALLFAAKVPRVGERSAFAGLPSVAEANLKHRNSPERFLNYHAKLDMSRPVRFFTELVDVLCFKVAWASVSVAWRRGKFYYVPFRIVDGLAEWCFIAFILLFPILVMSYVFLLVECKSVKSFDLWG